MSEANILLAVVGALGLVLAAVIWVLVWVAWGIVKWENRP